VAAASEEVALPVTGHGAVLDFGGPRADRDRVDDLSAALALARRGAGAPHHAPGAQMLQQFLLQHAARLDIERAVDGLVRHVQLRLVGEGEAQPAADLFGRPALLELCRNEIAQARPGREAAGLGTTRRLPRAAVRPDRAILHAAAVSRHLATDRRRGATKAAADGAVGLARGQRTRDELAFLERQHALRSGAEAGRDAALQANHAVD